LTATGPASPAGEALFPGFRSARIRARETEIHVVVGGQGPPVLLLHGYPQTHACWHRIAPALAARFTVVCPDLRGYGESGRPPSDPAHRAYSKRVMARDQVETMAELDFQRFAVVGHDRGGRVAYRLALDHPERVTRLAILDIVPTFETWAAMDRHAGLATYHWFFLAQPAGFPERLIGADPDYFLRWTLESWAGRPDAFNARALAEYRRAFRDPEMIRATCEDYRAGASVDVEDDAGDRGRRRIDCPVLALWAERQPGAIPWDPVAVWREWAGDVRGQAVPGGHFMAEEAPAETLAALEPFLAP
jgi:haloacetate dehalogenase